jgi:hypothetical protein
MTAPARINNSQQQLHSSEHIDKKIMPEPQPGGYPAQGAPRLENTGNWSREVRVSGCSRCPIRPVCGGCLAVSHSFGLNVFEERDPFCFMP